MFANGIPNHSKYLQSSLAGLTTDYWINLGKEDFRTFDGCNVVFCIYQGLSVHIFKNISQNSILPWTAPAEHLCTAIEFSIEIRFCLPYAVRHEHNHLFRSFCQLSTSVCTHICRVHSPSVDFNETIRVPIPIPIPVPIPIPIWIPIPV